MLFWNFRSLGLPFAQKEAFTPVALDGFSVEAVGRALPPGNAVTKPPDGPPCVPTDANGESPWRSAKWPPEQLVNAAP